MCNETKEYAAVRHMMKESISNPQGITVGRAYKIAIDYLEDEQQAIDLLTSERCSYTQAEINYMLYQKEYRKNYYQKQIKASNQVNAF